MSEITFKHDIKSAQTLADKIEAFTNEYESCLRIASGDLEDTSIKTLNFDKNDFKLRMIKIRSGKKRFNFSITDSLEFTQESIEGITRFKSHYILQVEDDTFSIIDCFNDCYLTYEDIEVKNLRHLSRSCTAYKLCTQMLLESMNNLISEGLQPREFSVATDYSGLYFEPNKIYNMDCMDALRKMGDQSVDFVLTDIPYGSINRFDSSKNRVNSRSLRDLDKGNADIMTFDINEFLEEAVRVTSNSICIFCGYSQISDICNYFSKMKLTTRLIIWEKTQFSPMNGDLIYGANIEVAVWGKKHNNGVFNAFCKGTIFRYGQGSSKIHPTQKNVDLFKELIEDNTNPNMIILDPCIGSGTTAIACLETGRRFIGFEKSENWYNVANERISKYNITECN